MTASDFVPAPLEANDPPRARALKARIRDRVSDIAAIARAAHGDGGRPVASDRRSDGAG
jgi:hypothetical protein